MCLQNKTLEKGRAHFGKRKNSSLQAISPFLAVLRFRSVVAGQKDTEDLLAVAKNKHFRQTINRTLIHINIPVHEI